MTDSENPKIGKKTVGFMFWNKKIHDKYAKKDAAFLFLIASNPGIMKDIDSHKLKVASLDISF